MLRVALFSRVRSWKDPKWSLVDEWINKMYYTRTMEYCLVAQLCLTLWYPLDCSLSGYSVHGITFLGKNTGVGCYNFLLQGIFLTQGLNPHLPISYISGRFFTCWTIKYYSALKRMEILTYVTLDESWKPYAKWNTCYKKTNVAGFRLYEVSRGAKFMETEGRMVIARGWRRGTYEIVI